MMVLLDTTSPNVVILTSKMKKDKRLWQKKQEITIRSSAAEYLTYVAAIGDNPMSVDIR
jgi:hypothetical protein